MKDLQTRRNRLRRPSKFRAVREFVADFAATVFVAALMLAAAVFVVYAAGYFARFN